MTSGTRVVDARVPPTTFGVGAYTSKTWNGVDSPKRALLPRQPYTDALIPSNEELLTKFGSTTSREAVAYLNKHSPLYETFRMPFSLKTFRRPVKRARTAWNSYSASGYRRYDTKYRRADPSDPVLNWVPGDSDGQSIYPTLFTANDQLALISKLKEKAYGSDFNAAIALAEGHKTVKMIASNAISLAKAFHHARKGDVSGAVQALTDRARLGDRSVLKTDAITRDNLRRYSVKNSSSLVAELQYGVKPLLQDVQAGATYLAHYLSAPLQHTVTVSKRLKSHVNPGVNPNPNLTNWAVDVSEVRKIKAVWKENLSNISGLGFLDPASVAWEIMPWSFVFDWFLPIGQWLEARSAATLLPGAVFYESRLIQRHSTSLNPRCTTPEVANIRSFSYVRLAATTQLQVPRPVFKPLNKALSVTHCINAIALLGTVLGGDAKRFK